MRSTVQFFHPETLVAPHVTVRPYQVKQLARSMRRHGWVGTALVGYNFVTDNESGVQLLSGTHRRAAAIKAGILVPVRVYPYAFVARCWGRLARWTALMRGRL